MSCCCCNVSLRDLGYGDPVRETAVKALVGLVICASITGVVMGVLGLHGVVPPSTALWVQVGGFGAVAISGGILIAASTRLRDSKTAAMIFTITLLTLPVLFGALGATNIIPPHDMLWAATVMCGTVVVGAMLTSGCRIAKDCADNDPPTVTAIPAGGKRRPSQEARWQS